MERPRVKARTIEGADGLGGLLRRDVAQGVQAEDVAGEPLRDPHR